MLTSFSASGIIEKLSLATLTAGSALGFYTLICLYRRKRSDNQPSETDSTNKPVTLLKILTAISYSFILYSIVGINSSLENRDTLMRWGGLLIIANVDLFKSVVPFELVFITFFSRFFLTGFSSQFLDSILGLSIIFAALFLINKLIQKFKRRSAIGFGDLMVCGLIGWFFGVVSGFRSVALGLLLAGIYALVFMLTGESRDMTYPMAPFLVLGTAITISLIH